VLILAWDFGLVNEFDIFGNFRKFTTQINKNHIERSNTAKLAKHNRSAKSHNDKKYYKKMKKIDKPPTISYNKTIKTF